MNYLRNKTTWYIIGALIVGLVVGGLVGGMHDRDRGERYGDRSGWGQDRDDTSAGTGTVATPTTATTTTTTTVDASLAQPGEHCGGNMTTAKSCTTGYHCAPEAGSHLPFGDVGGICVKN